MKPDLTYLIQLSLVVKHPDMICVIYH